MDKIARNLRIVLRAERLILDRQLSVARTGAWYTAIAVLIGINGLVMLNIAGFLALRDAQGGPVAALIVGAADFLLAGGVVVLGVRLRRGDDIRAVAEARDMAVRDLEQEMRNTVRAAERLRGRASVYARDPVGMVVAKVVEQVLEALGRR
jgi:hypothetical protein